MGKAQRVARLLEMVTLLQSGSGWKAGSLAERFGVSRTRVFNDVQALRQAGIPVRSTSSGYTIAPSFFLPSVRLTPPEVLSLLLSSELFPGGIGEEVHRSAREKLMLLLPEPLRASAQELMKRMSIALPTAGVDAAVFAALRDAVAARRRVAILYLAREAEDPERLELEPYGVAFRKHAWYLVGYSVTHRGVRTFRVSRVRQVEPLPVRFTVPEDFSLEERFKGAWYVFGGEPQEIDLRFSRHVARLVRERAPHPGQVIQTLSDGSILYRARVRNLDEVAWWLVQYGGEAEALRPAVLREKVVELARGVLARYGLRDGLAAQAYRESEGETGARVAEPEPDE
jgi:predicted DNA-binding transcriptional regulator YafY